MTSEKKEPRRAGSTVPFGYRLHEQDASYLVAVPLELEALAQARRYYEQGYTMAEIRRWLLETTKRKVSLPGLKKILLTRKDFK